MSMTSSVDAGCGIIARTSYRLSSSSRSGNMANAPNDNGRTVLISARKISVLGAFAAAALSSQAALAQISDDVVKIGVLTDMNGPASTPTGQGSVTAAQMAIDDFGGKVCSPYTMQWVIDTRALAVGTAQAVVKRGGDSWFFITDDYAFGHSLERDASTVINANGGKVLGSVKPPLATPDLSSFVLQAQASKAKIIGIAAGPPNNMNEIKTGSEFGIFKGGQQMAALLALITDIHSLGLPAAQGLLLTTSFYWDMDDKTREWSKRYFAKMNRMPTMWQAGVYSSVMYYLNAVKDSG